jgi:hypothetical protein
LGVRAKNVLGGGGPVTTPLPEQEILSTLSEIGIAIVGFSVVADLLRSRSSTDVVRLYTLRDVAEIGLMCAVLSTFPSVLHGFGVPVDSTWRIAGGVALGWAIAGITGSVRRRGPGTVLPTVKRHWLAATIVYLMIGISLVLSLTNLLSPGPLSGARHVAWALALLAQAGTMFIFSVFHLPNESPAA